MASAPIHAYLEFFYPVLPTILFPRHWLLSHITIVETTDSGEKGMNPVAMTIIIPQKEYWLSRGLNQRPPVLKSAMLLLTEGAGQRKEGRKKPYMPYVPDCPGQSRILILCPSVPEIMKLSRKFEK